MEEVSNAISDLNKLLTTFFGKPNNGNMSNHNKR